MGVRARRRRDRGVPQDALYAVRVHARPPGRSTRAADEFSLRGEVKSAAAALCYLSGMKREEPGDRTALIYPPYDVSC